MGAPLMTSFPQGFAQGFMVRGLPILQTQPGKVLWVSDTPVLSPVGVVAGSDNNRGTFYRPFATLAGALAQCTPGAGDIVLVKPYHTETISTATAMNLSCSDVAIIGLGAGNARPTFTLDTLTTSTVNITGNNVSVQNCNFIANFLSIAAAFTFAQASVTGSLGGGVLTVTAVGSGTLYQGNTITGTSVNAGTVILGQLSGTTGGVGTYAVSGTQTLASTTLTTLTRNFAMDNCQVKDTSSILDFLVIFKASTTDNASDGLSITNSEIIQSATSGVCNLLTPSGSMDRVRIQGNTYTAKTTGTGAGIAPIAAGKLLTNLTLDQNVINLQQAQSMATGILITTNGTTNSGMISRNLIQALDDTTEILVTASSGFSFSQNFYAGVADKSGYLLPAADS